MVYLSWLKLIISALKSRNSFYLFNSSHFIEVTLRLKPRLKEKIEHWLDEGAGRTVPRVQAIAIED